MSPTCEWCRQVVVAIRDVRKIAIPLVDAFNLSDFIVNSPFGRFVSSSVHAQPVAKQCPLRLPPPPPPPPVAGVTVMCMRTTSTW
mgnify:CR=1 FL=1